MPALRQCLLDLTDFHEEVAKKMNHDKFEAFGAVMAEHLAAGGMILASVHDPLPIPARSVEIGQ